MKYSELPQEYRDLEIPEEAKKNYFDDATGDYDFSWSYTNEGGLFWSKCDDAKTIEELPPIPNKKFELPKKWCVKAEKDSDVHKWFEKKLKYVRDAELKNNNLENIKEMRDLVNDKEIVSQRDTNVPLSNQETLEPFYMIYVDGASGSTRKHDRNSAIIEAQRLSKETDKKVFILRSEYCFERKIDINLVPIKKD